MRTIRSLVAAASPARQLSLPCMSFDEVEPGTRPVCRSLSRRARAALVAACAAVLSFGAFGDTPADGFYDYLKGDGTAYINLRTKLSERDSVKVVFRLHDTKQNQMVYGSRVQGGSSDSYLLGFDFNNPPIMSLDFQGQRITIQDYDAYCGKKLISYCGPYVRGIVESETGAPLGKNAGEISYGTKKTQNDIYLFWASGKVWGAPFSERIYSFVVTSNAADRVVTWMDLRPCVENGVAGMKDVVSGRFYPNDADGGAFTVGNEEKPTPKPLPEIPAGTYVDYLQGDGLAYIDTGLYLDERDWVDCVFEIPEKANQMVYGHRKDGSARDLFLMGIDSSGFFSLYYYANDEKWKTQFTWPDDLYGRKLRTMNSASCRNLVDAVTGDMVQSSTMYCSSKFEMPTDTCYLFHASGTVWGKESFKGKVYSFKVRREGEIRMELVPYVRSEDNLAGMLDLVSHQFFTNKVESGAFSAGPALKAGGGWTPARYVEYVETVGENRSGAQYVRLDYTPTVNSSVEAKIALRDLAPTRSGASAVNAIFCARGMSIDEDTFTLNWSNDGFRWDYLQKGVFAGHDLVTADTPFVVKCSSTGLTVNGNAVAASSPYITTIPNKMVLFASYRRLPGEWGFLAYDDADVSFAQMRLYNFKAYDGEELRVWLRPCVDAYGDAGLWDDVNKKMYYTPTGLELTAGPIKKPGIIITFW